MKTVKLNAVNHTIVTTAGHRGVSIKSCFTINLKKQLILILKMRLIDFLNYFNKSTMDFLKMPRTIQ